MTDINFCHFGSFFALLPHCWSRKLTFAKNVQKTWTYYPFTHVYHKWRSYDIWFLKYKAPQTKFFVILGHFLPFDPPNNHKNQNFEKMKKKITGDIIILQLCTTNENHMMYGSRDMNCSRHFFCHLGNFLPVYANSNPENQNFCKTENNSWRQVYKKSWSYAILFLRYGMPQMVIVISDFGLVFAILPHRQPQNSKLKKWKKRMEI